MAKQLLLVLFLVLSSGSSQKVAPSPKSPPKVAAPSPKPSAVAPVVAPSPNATSTAVPPAVAPAPVVTPSAPAPTNGNATSPPNGNATSPPTGSATSPPPNGNATSPASAPGPSPSPSSGGNGTLDPTQIAALEALKVPVAANPCAGSHSTMICDEGSPFRRLIFLQLQYCPADASLSEEALKNLTGLQALSFFDCPMKPAAYIPPSVVTTLTSFSCVSSLGRTSGFEDMQGLSGVWLSKLHRVQDLTVMDVVVNASTLSVVISNMTDLQELRITNASLKGTLPKTWPSNLTTVDLSLNNIQGTLPSFFGGELQNLVTLDVTGNNLTGHLPSSLGRLRNLQKLSVSSNGLSGPIPVDVIANLTSLTYLDLSGNHFNGTIPETLATLADLRYLDLRNNQLKGILPFNSSFLARLNTFKASGNPYLCYNSSITSSKANIGLPPCDDTGNPISAVGPALAPGEDLGPTPEPEQGKKTSKKKGPKTIVWAVATALAAIFLFIALVVVFSKWCRWKEV